MEGGEAGGVDERKGMTRNSLGREGDEGGEERGNGILLCPKQETRIEKKYRHQNPQNRHRRRMQRRGPHVLERT